MLIARGRQARYTAWPKSMHRWYCQLELTFDSCGRYRCNGVASCYLLKRGPIGLNSAAIRLAASLVGQLTALIWTHWRVAWAACCLIHVCVRNELNCWCCAVISACPSHLLSACVIDLMTEPVLLFTRLTTPLFVHCVSKNVHSCILEYLSLGFSTLYALFTRDILHTKNY